jgi:hypothetical protein
LASASGLSRVRTLMLRAASEARGGDIKKAKKSKKKGKKK